MLSRAWKTQVGQKMGTYTCCIEICETTSIIKVIHACVLFFSSIPYYLGYRFILSTYHVVISDVDKDIVVVFIYEYDDDETKDVTVCCHIILIRNHKVSTTTTLYCVIKMRECVVESYTF